MLARRLISGLAFLTVALAQTPPTPPPSYRFATGDSALDIPIEVVADGLVFVRAAINGHPGAFILDNAAQGFTVDPEFARAISLAPTGNATARGDGAGLVQAGLIRDVQISLGGFDLTHRLLTAISLKGLEPVIGHAVDGIIGSRLFDDFIVAIDYQDAKLSIYLPGHFQPPSGATALPARIDAHGFPFLQATVGLPGAEPFSAEFLVDGGANSYAEIYKPFCDSHHLPPPAMKLLSQPGTGVDGANESRDGRASRITVGPYSVANPPVAFPQITEGLMAATDHAGLIGGEFLQRFTVVYDTPARRIWMTPNSNYATQPEYDQSGLKLRAAPPAFDQFTVARIIPNSPAADAGVQPGDVVQSVNGASARNLTLTQLRTILSQSKPAYAITVLRAGRQLTVTLHPRPLI